LELTWKTFPRGTSGTAQLQLKDGKTIEVGYRRDKDGLWLELPGGVVGFDLQGETGDDGAIQFLASQRGLANHWAGLSFQRGAEQSAAASASGAKKGMRVRAQMPGKIIRIMVAPGAVVEKDQPILVMEAMKMENEIKAPQSGKINLVKVTEGQNVETGADLCTIDPV
jgi:biotin carboxyl carrier protein